jgi:SagB-type dehydrogenase family enzyme
VVGVETATQALHRLTSYSPDGEWTDIPDDPRAARGFEANDLDRFPWFYKRYPEPLPGIDLPRELPATDTPAIRVLAGTADIAHTEPDLPQLSRLLHLSAGIVRTMERPYGTWLFRAAGSAGGRFPLEVYVAVPEGGGLPPGVHWYHPQEHALRTIAPPPTAGAPAIVVTGVPWRTGWRYRERGYRHIYWDSGTMLAQLLAAADSAGVPGHLFTRFPDAAVTALVGADGVHEWPVAVVALGAGPPAIGATGAAAAGEVDEAPVEFPLETEAQRAGDRDALGPEWERGAPADIPAQAAGNPIDTVVLARGSQRLMDPTRGLSRDVLATSMGVATRGISIPHFVAVHAVEGVAPGIYRWPDLASPRSAGPMRDELYRVALDQGLARDASFVTIATADFEALDDRGYRDAHLAAGMVEGRLHLAAYALGASASGMTFLDSEIPALVGEPLDGVLFTCVGVPEYASAAGGSPGRPVLVRKVVER